MRIKKLLGMVFAAGVIISLASISAMADSTGWQQDENGDWRYFTSETVYVEDAWKSIDGNWYYFKEDGIAIVDKWVFIDSKLYHFDKSGHMEKNKWIDCGDYVVDDEIQGYMNSNPEYAKVYNEYIGKKEWRYVGPDGAAYSGWKKIGGEWYYFNDFESGNIFGSTYYFGDYNKYGLMHYGWLKVSDDVMYNFDGNGRYRKNCWYKGSGCADDVQWYYFGSDGVAAKGWKSIDGKWYYFGDWSFLPCMRTGMVDVYYSESAGRWMFADNGQLMTGPLWKKTVSESGKVTWQYIKSDGSVCRGEWLVDNGKHYYIDKQSNMVCNTTYFIEGKEYSFNSNGQCTNYNNPTQISGWHRLEFAKYASYYDEGEEYENPSEYWVFVGTDGNLLCNKWISQNGNWYYLDSSGYMIQDTECFVIDGKLYSFDKNGKCTNPNPSFAAGWNKITAYGQERWSYVEGGKFCTGWKKINNKWFYFDSWNGMMYGGTDDDYWFIDDHRYFFNKKGELVTGWAEGNFYWYYSDSDGALYQDKWLQYKGSWYYFGISGDMYQDWYCASINGKLYSFDQDGKCINPSGKGVYEVYRASQGSKWGL